MSGKKKQATKRAIENAASVKLPEEHLALAVVLKAIDDAGRVKDKTNHNAIIDSIPCIKQGGLDIWLEAIGVEPGFFRRVLKINGVMK